MFFFFQAEDGIRDLTVTGVQTCALPISGDRPGAARRAVARWWPRRRARPPWRLPGPPAPRSTGGTPRREPRAGWAASPAAGARPGESMGRNPRSGPALAVEDDGDVPSRHIGPPGPEVLREPEIKPRRGAEHALVDPAIEIGATRVIRGAAGAPGEGIRGPGGIGSGGAAEGEAPPGEQ